jgi:hypothetical protein
VAFYDDGDLGRLRIARMVFHLVGPTPDSFLALEAVEPGPHADFFLDRIRAVNAGTPYRFSDASATRERLRRIAGNPTRFQAESEALAQDFQNRHGGATARGAFLLFELGAGDASSFALLKHDDEQVLAYALEEGPGGRMRVSLAALERTFVQNKDALQKAALVRLTETAGDLTVTDRQNPQKVARFFENFLDATRVYSDADLSRLLAEATVSTLVRNRDLVAPDVLRDVTQRTHDALAAGARLGADDQKRLLERVIDRAVEPGDPLLAKWEARLRADRIQGMPVRLDAAGFPPPEVRRLVTENRIEVRIPREAARLVEVTDERILIRDSVETDTDEPGGRR